MMRECILCGLLFKAVLHDEAMIGQLPLKLSYKEMLEAVSRWAERRHHRLKRELRQQGCVLLDSEKQGTMYLVRYRQHGYYREALYSAEVLRAECQQLLQTWLDRHGA